MCEAQVALDHLRGHEIGYIILIWRCLRVVTAVCGDSGPRMWQGDGEINEFSWNLCSQWQNCVS